MALARPTSQLVLSNAVLTRITIWLLGANVLVEDANIVSHLLRISGLTLFFDLFLHSGNLYPHAGFKDCTGVRSD